MGGLLFFGEVEDRLLEPVEDRALVGVLSVEVRAADLAREAAVLAKTFGAVLFDSIDSVEGREVGEPGRSVFGGAFFCASCSLRGESARPVDAGLLFCDRGLFRRTAGRSVAAGSVLVVEVVLTDV